MLGCTSQCFLEHCMFYFTIGLNQNSNLNQTCPAVNYGDKITEKNMPCSTIISNRAFQILLVY